jgi:hypothetical protein
MGQEIVSNLMQRAAARLIRGIFLEQENMQTDAAVPARSS